MMPDLSEYCSTDFVQTRLLNALWRALHEDDFYRPSEWRPTVEEVQTLNLRTIHGLGEKGISIVLRWLAASLPTGDFQDAKLS